MRPLTDEQKRLLRSPHGCATALRVDILGPDNVWHELHNLFGRDFLQEATVDESLDQPVGEATVRVLSFANGLALSPLMTSSRVNNLAGTYDPLIAPNRTFRVGVVIGPRGQEPTLPVGLFHGRIDSYEEGPGGLSFRGRDLSGVLQDVWLEQEHVLGSEDGVPLETVCTQLVTAAGMPFWTFFVPEPSAFMVGKYRETVSPVFEALNKILTMRGWEVRQKWRPDTDGWGHWLYGPDRANTTPVWTYGPDAYEKKASVTLGLENVRTAVEVVYSDVNDLDEKKQARRKTVRKENLTALAKYGFKGPAGELLHRFCRITEASTSAINTAAEAERLAQDALDDLSITDLGAEVEVALHPALEVGDVVRLLADGESFDSDQVLAVRQATLTLSSRDMKTRLTLLGKPALSPRLWLGLEARPGVAPMTTFTGPEAPQDLAVANSVTGAVLTFTDPSGKNGNGVRAEEFELHLGDTPDFTPSAETLVSASSTTRFDLTGLTAGETAYAKVRSRTGLGATGDTSEAVTLAPRYVSPSVLQPRVNYGALPLNADFEAQDDSGAPPDGWSVTLGEWGQDVVSVPSTFSGLRALRLQGVDHAIVVSAAAPVKPGLRYLVEGFATGSSGAILVVGIDWLDASLSVVSTENFYQTMDGSAQWKRCGMGAAAPSTARYFRARIESLLGAPGRTIEIDAVHLNGSDILQEPAVAPAYLGSWDGYTANGRAGAKYYKDTSGRVHLEGSIAGGAVGTVAFYLPAGYRPPAARDFAVASSAGFAHVSVGADGAVLIALGSSTWTSLDGLSFRAALVGA